jgi:hypothetical protein
MGGRNAQPRHLLRMHRKRGPRTSTVGRILRETRERSYMPPQPTSAELRSLLPYRFPPPLPPLKVEATDGR